MDSNTVFMVWNFKSNVADIRSTFNQHLSSTRTIPPLALESGKRTVCLVPTMGSNASKSFGKQSACFPTFDMLDTFAG